ncbi:MAG: DUF6064 family protein [Gemmatimonadota bacterium]|jgi:hypothetical protein
MELPFTQEEFFRVFARYNQGVWPAQLALAAAALVALVASWRGGRGSDRTVSLILGALWIWMGGVYHWLYFTDVNPGAWLFGALFVVQGVLFCAAGLRREPLRYELGPDRWGLLAGAVVTYGLVVYPVLGLAVGHAWPSLPTFGLPCPTTIFTMGLLLVGAPRVPWTLLVVPVLWSLVGGSAAFTLGVVQDLALPVAGVLGGALVLWRTRTRGRGGTA